MSNIFFEASEQEIGSIFSLDNNHKQRETVLSNQTIQETLPREADSVAFSDRQLNHMNPMDFESETNTAYDQQTVLRSTDIYSLAANLPNGVSFSPKSEFRLNLYEFYYHVCYIQRYKLKEARHNYIQNPCTITRDKVYVRELDVVIVFVKLLKMRALLKQNSFSFSNQLKPDQYTFCMNHPSIIEWLKAVGIKSKNLLETISNGFQSIENLIECDIHLLTHTIDCVALESPIDRDVFLCSIDVLKYKMHGTTPLSILGGERIHFSWVQATDHFKSNDSIPSSSAPNTPCPILAKRPNNSHIPLVRAPTPDPFNIKGRFSSNHLSVGTSSDPYIYPLTPSPGPPRVSKRSITTLPRSKGPKKPIPSPSELFDNEEAFYETNKNSNDNPFINKNKRKGKNIIRRIFKRFLPKNSAISNGKETHNTIMMRYEAEPWRVRTSHHPINLDDNVFPDSPRTSFSQPTPSPDSMLNVSKVNSQIRINSAENFSPSPQPTEWDTNLDKIRFVKEIKRGRYYSLSLGNWHGQVLVKRYLEMNDTLHKQFHQEFNALRNIRHDNVILFRGACTTPPDLLIVTSVKQSPTLHNVIQLNDKHPIENALAILKEISQAMTYLHDRGVVHQNLTSETIYLERHTKPILTDIAVNPFIEHSSNSFNFWDLPRTSVVSMAPEILNNIHFPMESHVFIVPFSEKSDIFAFGSVWYELYTGQLLYSGDPIESVLYKVSRGYTHPRDIIISTKGRIIQEELKRCWNFTPSTRPCFQQLELTINTLPQTHISNFRRGPLRSTSQPTVQVPRSNEAILSN